MNNNDQLEYMNEGTLPPRAPLANPYVPFQKDNPPRYEPRKALVRGTLFPGLDLPFMGMINKNEKTVTPLTELQTMAFAIQDLALYLDTHQNDQEAFEVLSCLQKLYHDGKKQYEEKFGPLTIMSDMGKQYSWLKDPWPWEYAKNREV